MGAMAKPVPAARDAVSIPDRRLVGPAINYMLHVPTIVGRHWVATNAAGLRAVGANLASVANSFSSGLLGSAMIARLGISTAAMPALTVAELRAWLTTCRRHGGRPNFDVFFARGHHDNGDAGYVVTLSPPPGKPWRSAFMRHFRCSMVMDAPVMRLGGQPALHVVGGSIAWRWTESDAVRRRASKLWRATPRSRRPVCDPYEDRAALDLATTRERRELRRMHTRTIRPLLRAFGM
jgi:hypothetical protein